MNIQTNHKHNRAFPTESLCEYQFPLKSEVASNAEIGRSLREQLPVANVVLLPLTSSVTPETIREYVPHGRVCVTDFHVQGIEKGIQNHYGFLLDDILVIDHHAPVKSMYQPISSAHLAMKYVASHGPVPTETPIVINHTDCDSVLATLILRGLIPPHEIFGDAALAADHTGTPNLVADILQHHQDSRDLNSSAHRLADMLEGIIPQEEVTSLLKKHDEVQKEVAAARMLIDGPCAFGILKVPLDSGQVAALYPDAALVVTATPVHQDGEDRYWVKVRRGNGAPPDFSLFNLDITSFDPNFGGRWNAGSNRRGGFTLMPPEEYFAKIKERLASVHPELFEVR